jgi:hypothetical protein
MDRIATRADFRTEVSDQASVAKIGLLEKDIEPRGQPMERLSCPPVERPNEEDLWDGCECISTCASSPVCLLNRSYYWGKEDFDDSNTQ